jgi:hypothetical protein
MSNNINLIHSYELNGSLSDSLGGPSLVSVDGTITNYGYIFGRDKGLSLTNGLLNIESYTIIMDITFDTLSPRAWQRILDFKNRTSDYGLYVYRSGSGHGLQFYPYSGTVGTITAGKKCRYIITRNQSGQVATYVDNSSQFIFNDSINRMAVSNNNVLLFCIDDFVVPNENDTGIIHNIQIYDGPLSEIELPPLPTASPPQTRTPTATPTPTPTTPSCDTKPIKFNISNQILGSASTLKIRLAGPDCCGVSNEVDILLPTRTPTTTPTPTNTRTPTPTLNTNDCQCNAINAPYFGSTVSVDGIDITASYSGDVTTYVSAWESCGVTTPANSLYLGSTGSFQYTMHFNAPINNIKIILTATGDGGNENFILTTNTDNGIPFISSNCSCYSSINGNIIIDEPK